MYLFVSKFNHSISKYASTELWTITFPYNIKTDDHVIVVFQWTESADGKEKYNDKWVGKITKAEGSGEININIFKDDSTLYYWYVQFRSLPK